jgi:Fur family ferric uptake transcriptional regulator
MKEHEIIFEQYLRKKGLKLTSTRKIILTTVFDLHEHFDVDLLYEQIRKTEYNVSRATIYRTIPLLIEAGLVKQAVRSYAKESYEHVFGHPKHLHLVCEECENVIEEDVAPFAEIIAELGQKNEFKIRDYTICIKGLCSNCSGDK